MFLWVCLMLRLIDGMFANHLPFSSPGRGGPKRGIGVYSQGATLPCAGPGLLLPLLQHLRGFGPLACKPGNGNQQPSTLVRELMLLQQHVPQRLCWCRRVETVRLQGLCVSDVGTHCLKSTESFPLKHVGMPPPASLLGGCYFWLWGYGK